MKSQRLLLLVFLAFVPNRPRPSLQVQATQWRGQLSRPAVRKRCCQRYYQTAAT